MDAVAVTVDILAHAGIPAGGLVAVVNASFQQLTHGELGKSHVLSFSGLNLDAAVFRVSPNRRMRRDFSPYHPSHTCEVARLYPGAAAIARALRGDIVENRPFLQAFSGSIVAKMSIWKGANPSSRALGFAPFEMLPPEASKACVLRRPLGSAM
jgi:hypothetical protein